MYATSEPALEDYFQAIKRRGYAILAGVLIGAVVGGFLATKLSTDHGRSRLIPVVKEGDLAAASGVNPGLLGELDTRAQAALLREFLAAHTSQGISFSVTVPTDGQILTVSASGSGVRAIEALTEKLVSEYKDERRQRTVDRLDGNRQILGGRLESATSDLQDLDARFPTASPELIRSLEVQRLELIRDVVSLQDTISALDRLETQTTGGLGEPFWSGHSSTGGSIAAPALFGAILGGLLAAVGIVIKSFFDHGLRTSDSVAFASGAPTLAVIPRGEDHHPYLALCTALQQVGVNLNAGTLMIGEVSSRVAITEVAAGVARGFEELGVSVTPIVIDSASESSETVPGHYPTKRDGGVATRSLTVVAVCEPLEPNSEWSARSHQMDAVLLVAESGKTSDRAFSATANTIRQCGGRLIGGILVGVPRGEFEWAIARRRNDVAPAPRLSVGSP